MMLKVLSPLISHAGISYTTVCSSISTKLTANTNTSTLCGAMRRSFASATAAQPVAGVASSDATKSKLNTLRKKTGYSFQHCKKALEQFDGNVLDAERWLHQQAQQEGWSKATKLEGRKTAEGLVGLKRTDNAVALVEVNCETDFVARNHKFHELVARIADSCVSNVAKGTATSVDAGVTTGNGQNEFFRKTFLPGDHIIRLSVMPNKQKQHQRSIESSEPNSIKDLVALYIGQVGENIQVRRGAVYSIASELAGINQHQHEPYAQLSGYIHAANTSMHASVDGVMFGRFGAILVWKSTATGTSSAEDRKDQENIGRLVCQHIVGMRPTSIGNLDDQDVGSADDETRLLHQEFLAEPEITVGALLQDKDMQVLDFVRFACGEDQQQQQQDHSEEHPTSSNNRSAVYNEASA